LAAGAFALDVGNGLTIAGEVKAGAGVFSVDDGNEDTAYDTTVRGYNNDAGMTFRTRLTATYTADWGGAKLRYQSGTFAGSAGFAPTIAYGWANFLDQKIVLSGGVIGDDLWGLGKLATNVFDPALDNVTGVRAEFKLVDGLSLGLALPVHTALTSHLTIDHAFAPVIGGLYKSPLVSVALGVAFKAGTDPVPEAYGYKPQEDPSLPPQWTSTAAAKPAYDSWVDAIIGIQVNPISALTIVVDGRIDTRKFDDHGKSGYVRIGPKVVYATGPLTAHLQGDILIPNESEEVSYGFDPTSAPDYSRPDYTNRPPVEKAGDKSVAFRVGAEYKVTDTIVPYFQVGSDNVLWLAGQEASSPDPYIAGAGLYAKPGVKITLGTSNIEIFDKINRIGAVSWKNAENDDVSPVTNQLQVDFNWVF
jgi:hypothetical protein